ncbi:hypothetical protein BDV98DRAFT_601859 [Pterulicium gracile]|uniref:Uncharacterized protein n=1 Tax=Pterulicium gracile TaxID=1884261 RepID=A0A5C3QQY0_9AGAR|nr:hypothetical protein BDV98DRAFT_601859 [Pterula gracilis]
MSDSISSDLSSLSLGRPSSSSSQNGAEDWDTSFSSSTSSPQFKSSDLPPNGHQHSTPRNSVAFPAEGGDHDSPGGPGRSKRSLSELLRLHAEKGTDIKFSAEEASRIAEVLNNWINTGSEPYEEDDDFFSRAQDDSSPSILQGQRSASAVSSGRPRGQSEGASLAQRS